MAYTSGIKTIGAVTSDYLTIDAAIADYGGAVSGLTGNLTWMIQADTTWTVDFNIHAMNNYTFRITCGAGLYHQGNPNAGVAIYLSDPFVKLSTNIYHSHSSNSFCIIENIVFRHLNGGPYARINLLGEDAMFGLKASIGNILRNNIFINIYIALNQSFYQAPYPDIRQIVANNKFYVGYISYNASQNLGNPILTDIIENNSFHALSGNMGVVFTGNFGATNAYCIVRNNAFNCPLLGNYGFMYILDFVIKPYGYNNKSSNSTAVSPIQTGGGTTTGWQAGSSGNSSGLSSADFSSIDPADADFLEINQSLDFTADDTSVNVGETVNYSSTITSPSALFQTGDTAVSAWNTADIKGNQRPDQDGKVSIGCHEREEIVGAEWDLDDGKTSTNLNPSTSYNAIGMKDISVEVEYEDGTTETISKPDYIEVKGYNLDFVGEPLEGISPLDVRFQTFFEAQL